MINKNAGSCVGLHIHNILFRLVLRTSKFTQSSTESNLDQYLDNSKMKMYILYIYSIGLYIDTDRLIALTAGGISIIFWVPLWVFSGIFDVGGRGVNVNVHNIGLGGQHSITKEGGGWSFLNWTNYLFHLLFAIFYLFHSASSKICISHS